MARIYVSTFITGAESIIKERLLKDLQGAVIVRLNEGIVFYRSECAPADAAKLGYFNNTFIQLARFAEKGLTFEKAVDEVCSINFMKDYYNDRDTRSFRIMFSDENTFVGVKDFYRNKIELNISRRVRLKLNKSKPDTEFWFLKRSEGTLLFLQRLSTAKAKNIQKGRLRPELADMMCYLADIKGSDIVCDPFAGYGAIPEALLAHYKPKRVLCSDISKEMTEELQKKWGTVKRLTIQNIGINALEKTLGRAGVDKIITDPPWGLFDNSIDIIQFYTKLISVFAYVLKDSGKAVVLTDRSIDIKKILVPSLKLSRMYNILVNGKKARINVIIKA